MEKLINIENLSYFKTLMDNKNNEKFGITELPISSDSKVDLTQVRDDATPGKLYKVTDPNEKFSGELYFGTHAITFRASMLFTSGSNVSVQPGTIILSTGKYGLIYVFPTSTASIYQIEISTRENYYQAYVYDTTTNYTYSKAYHIMPSSEITTTTGKTAFTQDSEARTFTAVGAEGVTYENVITLTTDVKNILIHSLGSLVGDVGPADQKAQISITDESGVTSQLLDTSGLSEDLINTGHLTSGSKITLTYVSGTYEPANAQHVFTLEYYVKETTDADLSSFISSLLDSEISSRRLADNLLQKNIDMTYSDLQNQIFNFQSYVIPVVISVELDSVLFQLSNIDNNNEFRLFGPSNSGVTLLELSFENISLTSTDEFKMTAIFQTSSSGCTFNIIEADSIKVKLTGDDVTDGVLNPVANKVYEIAFYWNGLFMSGIVRGVEHQAAVDTRNKITISNDSESTSNLFVFEDEDCTQQLACIEPGSSQDIVLTSENGIYAGYSVNDANICAYEIPSPYYVSPTKCDSTSYYLYNLTVTGQPASINFRDKSHEPEK